MLAAIWSSIPSTVKRSDSASAIRSPAPSAAPAPGQQHRELVAAEPGDVVAGAQRGADPRPELGQHAVAGVVAERVVELLEVVEVDHEQRERAVRLARPLDRAAQLAVEPAAVRQPGQLVGARLAAGLGQPAQLVDADRGADHRRHQRGGREADRHGWTLCSPATSSSTIEAVLAANGSARMRQSAGRLVRPPGRLPGGERHRGGADQPHRVERAAGRVCCRPRARAGSRSPRPRTGRTRPRAAPTRARGRRRRARGTRSRAPAAAGRRPGSRR